MRIYPKQGIKNMNELEKLNPEEKEMLLKAPAYFSLLAVNSDGGMDETEKKSAIEFSHVKTYSCDPIFREFYNEVEKVFVSNIEQLDNQLPKGKMEREKRTSHHRPTEKAGLLVRLVPPALYDGH